MAIPFYEPKTNTTSPNQQNQNNSQNFNFQPSAPNPIYDQVDGIGNATPPSQPMQSGSSSTTPLMNTVFLTPPPSPVTFNFATDSNIFETSTAAASTPSAASYEQQALAWKILAITMCKALKEYYVQTSSSKDAFTNQTVQVLPNGQVQPLWK